MDATQILREFAACREIPVDALRAAGADRGTVAPVFVRAIERYLAGNAEPYVNDALFMVFHLLGEWREKSAYRPLAALLRRPTDEIEDILSDAITDTSHRVMAAVFDGNPAPLYDVIRDPDADEFIRSRMCEALAMVALRDELPREEAARFLASCHAELKPRKECFVWMGWQSAIALLGLVELTPLVKDAFDRGSIIPAWLRFKNFEKNLRRGVAHPGAPRDPGDDEFTIFGDTIDELAQFYWDDSIPADEETPGPSGWIPQTRSNVPAVNPFKDVGRNDPCPCGSGRKFKKCCLDKTSAPPPNLEALLPELPPDLASFLDDEFPEDAGYDPLVAPDPEDWLAMDDDERALLVERYHRDTGVDVPRPKAHAMAHVIVENQIAEGDALPVRRTAQRLMAEGLDRHDAIHAIGATLMWHMNELVGGRRSADDPNAEYFAELERLTAADWLASG
jgi:hypothetical protein